MRVTDEHIAHYRRRGYAVIERFLTPDELADALDGYHRVFPSWEERRAGREPAREQNLFPWDHRGLKRTATHPELVAAAERIIGTRAIKLACCDINGRYAGDDVSTCFHLDQGNNTLAPILPEDHRNVTLALVLTDVQ